MKNKIMLIVAMFIQASFLHSEKIVMEGSNTMLPIAQRAAEVYMKKFPDKEVVVRGSGSGVGIAAIIDGNCDIANASRSVKQKELDLARKKGKELKANIIAMDGLVIIVHPSNKIENITKEQLQKIYTGKIKNWKELGGDDKKIVAISRESSSGTYEFFLEYVLDKKRVFPGAVMQSTTQGIVNMVAQTPGAIGYIGHGYISDKVKAIKYEGVEPTVENIIKNKYKLARPLYMYTLTNASKEVLDFIEFVKSPEGQKLVEEAGYIPLKK
jgi:phosphate transport system substrate-binding protein